MKAGIISGYVDGKKVVIVGIEQCDEKDLVNLAETIYEETSPNSFSGFFGQCILCKSNHPCVLFSSPQYGQTTIRYHLYLKADVQYTHRGCISPSHFLQLAVRVVKQSISFLSYKPISLLR